MARLKAELAGVEAQSRGRVGVYVRDPDRGDTVSLRGEQRWYLASMVKLPVSLAVLRAIDRDEVGLDTTVTLRAADYVDGAGPTSGYPVGTHLSVRFLLEQMMALSDNTATDMLIDLVGVADVNAGIAALVPEGFGRITSLAETRRLIYGELVPNTDRLRGQDLLALRRERSDAERIELLARLVGAPPKGRTAKPPTSLDPAYDAYYASGVNAGRLDAYADLLAIVADGKALSARSTDYLLRLMERAQTGTQRLKAGLPPLARFAHKTGTQRRRICDAGVARVGEAGRERRLLVVACVRDEPSLERAEAALQQVGAAVCRSGALTYGVVDAPFCPAPAQPTGRLPAVADR